MKNFCEHLRQALINNKNNILQTLVINNKINNNKEVGHKLAEENKNYIISILSNIVDIQPGKKIRSFDDFSILNNDKCKNIFDKPQLKVIPANVKLCTSIQSSPNACSINRTILETKNNEFTYLIIIHKLIGTEIDFYVFNLYDNLSLFYYNDGPQQLMIRMNKISQNNINYERIDPKQIIQTLNEYKKDGLRKMLKNRKKHLDKEDFNQVLRESII